jgi:hypothetical protein
MRSAISLRGAPLAEQAWRRFFDAMVKRNQATPGSHFQFQRDFMRNFLITRYIKTF